jgi:CO/xanthine dehydrogenase Mo-binding subunit
LKRDSIESITYAPNCRTWESLLDELAEKIDMDPIDLRMANAMDPNTRPVIHGE